MEDIEVCKKCLGSAAVDTSGFEALVAGEGKSVHNTFLETRLNEGMSRELTYAVGDDVFFGRGHLLTSAGYSQVNRVQHPMSQTRW